MGRIKPLKSRTMKLDELQKATLKLYQQVRRQMNRQPWQGGMSDGEFLDREILNKSSDPESV